MICGCGCVELVDLPDDGEAPGYELANQLASCPKCGLRVTPEAVQARLAIGLQKIRQARRRDAMIAIPGGVAFDAAGNVRPPLPPKVDPYHASTVVAVRGEAGTVRDINASFPPTDPYAGGAADPARPTAVSTVPVDQELQPGPGGDVRRTPIEDPL